MTGVDSRHRPRRDRKPAGVSDPNPRMSLELRSLLPYPNSCRGTSPHQQERDTKMAMLSFGGIDVSKDRLDVVVLPEEECSSVPNDAAGWAELVERLRGFSITAIGIEPSGGYERGAMRALLAAGMPVRQVNPFKLRQFARASGVLAKNDPLDARMIASFVTIMPTRPAQRQTPAAERLAEMLAIRRQLSTEKVAAENASRLLEDAMMQRLSRRRIVRLAADIDLLDKRMVEIVATDDALVPPFPLPPRPRDPPSQPRLNRINFEVNPRDRDRTRRLFGGRQSPGATCKNHIDFNVCEFSCELREKLGV